ncbi:hypothetical protein E4U54_006064 [Claviceps lovelessii]|nr:hypothetical protein E4U54_006064 [Claviceps lovelessii]
MHLAPTGHGHGHGNGHGNGTAASAVSRTGQHSSPAKTQDPAQIPFLALWKWLKRKPLHAMPRMPSSTWPRTRPTVCDGGQGHEERDSAEKHGLESLDEKAWTRKHGLESMD